MNKTYFVLALLSTFALVSNAEAVKLWKWVDKDGTVTYSEKKPPVDTAEEKEINPNQNVIDPGEIPSSASSNSESSSESESASSGATAASAAQNRLDAQRKAAAAAAWQMAKTKAELEAKAKKNKPPAPPPPPTVH